MTDSEAEILAHKLARALFWNGENPVCVDDEEAVKEVLRELAPHFPFVEYQTL